MPRKGPRKLFAKHVIKLTPALAYPRRYLIADEIETCVVLLCLLYETYTLGRCFG